MHVGQVISGSGHVVLIGFVMLGGLFSSDPEPLEATEVSVISGADFAALVAGARPPSSVTEVAQPAQPDPVVEQPDVPQAADPVEQTPTPEGVETPTPDAVPDVTELAPPPEAEVADDAPTLPTPPEETAVLVPNQAEDAVPLPADRIAPEPVARPEPEALPDPVQQEAVIESDTGEAPQEPQQATAPEEAAEEIVTEAEKPASAPPAAAPTASLRPPTRPSRPAPPTPTETPTETPVETPAPQTQTAQEDSSDTDAAVQAALDAAMAATNDAPAAPSGPPLSVGEKDALRVAVSSCWNLGSLSSDALNTTVTVSVAMSQDGKPVISSMKMLSSEGGTAAAAKQAYEAARRAIILCGPSGYNLPADKYDQWKEIEMTFNPERMRIK